jgi:two-component system phosphate regulon response regulator OmpR
VLKNGDETITLTTGEFALLNVLVNHPLKAQSRDRLLELSRTRDNEVSDRSIDVQIRRLRKILEDNPADPKFIQTVWGFGYVFVPTGEKR